MDALAAASAKQPAIVTTMSKSMAMPSLPALPAPAPVAPWHKTSPLPAPPWRSATLPAPPAKSSAPWQGLANRTAPISPAASPNGLTSLADRVAGVLGPAAGSTPQADVLPLAEYRSRLVTIYTMHNPSNVAKIDYLLGKYKGQEQLLYDSVCQKYQISRSWDGRQPLLPGSANAVPSNSSTGLPSLAALSLVPCSSACDMKPSLKFKFTWKKRLLNSKYGLSLLQGIKLRFMLKLIQADFRRDWQISFDVRKIHRQRSS